MEKPLAIILTALMLGGVVGYAAARHPFVDVPDGAYYADAVQWAWEQGITNGVDSEHFSPDKPVTRAELVTMLYRMNEQPEPEPTMPLPPLIEPTIQPDYAASYIGRMHIKSYSVGLYDTMDQQLVDLSDAAYSAKFSGGCRMIGDHDSEGLWIIRWLQPGDMMWIERKDGTVEIYELLRTDPHVRNLHSDVVDQNGISCIYGVEHDLLIATCNDSEGVDMTATFWRRVL